MKKNICFFNKDLEIGGVERQLYYLVNGLNKTKYDIMLLLCKKEGAFSDKISNSIGVQDLRASYSHSNKIIIAIKLFLFLLKNRPDIFVSFHVHLNIISIIACKLLSVKVFICFPGYCPRSRLSRLRRYFYTRADKLISVSMGVKASVVNNLHIPDSRKNIVIENCVDIREIRERSKEDIRSPFLDGDRFIIVSVGRLSAEKNFEVLIRASRLLPPDCLILFIGDGERREYLENLAAECGSGNRIKFLGFQLNPYKFIKKASVYVLSSNSEGLPTVVLEAMSLGVPCICSDYYGRTNDVIEHNVTGYIFPRDNHCELANAIKFFRDKKNREKRKTIVENSKRHVVNYSIEKYAQRYERVFGGS
ncbi:MAG TPA: glycosyltransferase [Nitrospirae bacterium]|nr:glycosyltransferase [Nitrospirota bacterium]